MKFPAWAPADVVRYYQDFLEDVTLGRSDLPERSLLEQHARAEGFRCFDDYDACANMKLDILKRLLSRPEMEKAWTWINSRPGMCLPLTAKGGVVGRVLHQIEEWVKSNRIPDSERRADFEEIASCAAVLSSKVRKYRGESVGFNNLGALVPEDYERVLREVLDPGLVARLDEHAGMPFPLRNLLWKLLPPIEDMIEAMAARAKENYFALARIFPRKIEARSAFRTFMIRSCTHSIVWSTVSYSPTVIATFVSVALDDPSINTDTVRKGAADLVPDEISFPAEDSRRKTSKTIRDKKRVKKHNRI